MISSEELRELMEWKSGSLRQFATECGVAYTTILNILNKGIDKSTMSVLTKICAYLDISIIINEKEELARIRKEITEKSEAERLFELYRAEPELQPAINKLLGYAPPSLSSEDVPEE